MGTEQKEAHGKPLLFISHKHSDRDIASVIRKAVYDATNRDVEVFQSSDTDAQGPQVGRSITAELTSALWRTGVVILVYTTEDQDWQWCMWECGVAMIPDSPDTRVIVLQCSTKAPSVFQGARRINARDKQDLRVLVKALLTDDKFFPGRPPIARNLLAEGPEVKQKAEALFDELAKVLPASNADEWSAQPLIRLHLSEEAVSRLRAEAPGGSAKGEELARKMGVTLLDAQASQIFGVGDLAPTTTLADLAARWAELGTHRTSTWLEDVACQVRCAARNELPPIGWGFLEDGGRDRYVPVLSRSRRVPAQAIQEFDVNLVRFDEFAATRASARMIPLEQLAYHPVDVTPLTDLKVKDLIERFKRDAHTRMPFLTADKRVKLVVHRSTVANYVADKLASGAAIDFSRLTVQDLIHEDADAGELFAGFAAVSPNARLREVYEVMGRKREVQDVFVTTTGQLDAPVLGWITNAMLAQQP